MRKKRIIKATILALTICTLGTGTLMTNTNGALAATDNYVNYKQTVSLAPTYVSDIDNVLYPATSQYYTYDSTQGVGSFKISKPSIIKVYFNWNTLISGTLSGTAWISKDADGLDVIGSAQKLSKPGDSMLIFLDPGTYYLNHYINIRTSSNNSNSDSVDRMKFGVAILAEDAFSDETNYASSYNAPNLLKIGEAKRGFLSTTSPIDYYKIRIFDYSQVNISFNFEQTDDTNVNKAECTLYDENNQKIISQRFSSSGGGRNILSQMLEEGTYYISLSGTTAATNVKVDAIPYKIETTLNTQRWTNKGVVVNVSTEFDTSEEFVVQGRVQDNKITASSIWSSRNENFSEIENGKFYATANGVYSIRVKDNNREYVLKRIKISNIDKTLPSVSGVKNNSTYTKEITIKFWDKGGSGIKSATIDGKKIKSGIKYSKKGSHTLKLVDNAGNIRTINFVIK